MERIATKLVKMWGEAASWIRDAAPSAHEDHVLRLDTSKARAELGWRPRLGIEAALEWTVAWYRAWRGGDKMIDFTRKLIGNYEQLCGWAQLDSRRLLHFCLAHRCISVTEPLWPLGVS